MADENLELVQQTIAPPAVQKTAALDALDRMAGRALEPMMGISGGQMPEVAAASTDMRFEGGAGSKGGRQKTQDRQATARMKQLKGEQQATAAKNAPWQKLWDKIQWAPEGQRQVPRADWRGNENVGQVSVEHFMTPEMISRARELAYAHGRVDQSGNPLVPSHINYTDLDEQALAYYMRLRGERAIERAKEIERTQQAKAEGSAKKEER